MINQRELSDNGLYALIWILIFAFFCAALFKGCEANNQEVELRAAKDEGERNAHAFAQSECTSKGGTMYAGQCVVCK